jgi:ABC-type uncharacterized transport system fused permease/ATPase subunit
LSSKISLILCGRLLPCQYRFLSREGSRLDARYKFVHTRVKTCAESIAFFGEDPLTGPKCRSL